MSVFAIKHASKKSPITYITDLANDVFDECEAKCYVWIEFGPSINVHNAWLFFEYAVKIIIICLLA